MLSSGKLAFDTYQTDNKDYEDISKQIDYFFNIAFFIEMIVKITAMGLFMDNGSYLRDSWN
jgi:hypothetical protein